MTLYRLLQESEVEGSSDTGLTGPTAVRNLKKKKEKKKTLLLSLYKYRERIYYRGGVSTVEGLIAAIRPS